MKVLVNGVAQDLTGTPTLLDLLENLALDPRMVVVEHNKHIVRRPALSDVRLTDGDLIEVVHFVGGG